MTSNTYSFEKEKGEETHDGGAAVPPFCHISETVSDRLKLRFRRWLRDLNKNFFFFFFFRERGKRKIVRKKKNERIFLKGACE